LLGDEEAAGDAGDGFVGGGDGDGGTGLVGLKASPRWSSRSIMSACPAGGVGRGTVHLGDLRFDEIAQPGHGVGDALGGFVVGGLDGHVELHRGSPRVISSGIDVASVMRVSMAGGMRGRLLLEPSSICGVMISAAAMVYRMLQELWRTRRCARRSRRRAGEAPFCAGHEIAVG